MDLDKCLANLKEGKILKERELKKICSIVRCFIFKDIRQNATTHNVSIHPFVSLNEYIGLRQRR